MPDNQIAPLIVGIPCDHRVIGLLDFHAVGEKYIDAVRDASGALPVLLPVTRTPLELDALLSAVHGIFMPGAPANVAPELYGGPPARAGNASDPQRDMTCLPLIRAVIERGIPFLAVCRGIQEMNVALGGTLHQFLHELPGHIDHRADTGKPLAEQYAPAHQVDIAPAGMLASILGKTGDITVNSLHSQGIDRLADPLRIEATAPDGTIEAVSVSDAPGFALGIQWHPEWRVAENPDSMAIFKAFGNALRARVQDIDRAKTGETTS